MNIQRFFSNETFLWWMGILSLGLMIMGAVLLPLIILRLPSDFLSGNGNVEKRRFPRMKFRSRFYAMNRNLIGGLLILAGFAMLLAPGQGMIFILVGLGVMDFPQKKEMLMCLARQRHVLGAINRFRERFHRSPLRLPQDNDTQRDGE